MGNILVIMPSEWEKQDTDSICQYGNTSIQWLAEMGQATTDLNERLRTNGYFAEGDNRYVQDVQVVAETIYFKFDLIRD